MQLGLAKYPTFHLLDKESNSANSSETEITREAIVAMVTRDFIILSQPGPVWPDLHLCILLLKVKAIVMRTFLQCSDCLNPRRKARRHVDGLMLLRDRGPMWI